MLKMLSKTLFFEDGAMMNAEDTRNSFGWRVMTERKQSKLTQQDVCDRLEKEFGIKITYGALSQIETGETKRFHIDMLFALAKIFDVNPYTLLTGEERGETINYSAEAEEVARMMDAMPPSMRRMMLDAAKATQQLAAELLASQRRIAQLLEENIMLLENGDRSIAHDYIDYIGYHRNAER